MKKISIKTKISADPAFRDSAEALFDYIEKLKETTFELDFKGVKFVSRSFAHQYLTRKKQTSKTIKEVNVSENVQKMLEVAAHPGPKPRIIDPEKVEVKVIR